MQEQRNTDHFLANFTDPSPTASVMTTSEKMEALRRSKTQPIKLENQNKKSEKEKLHESVVQKNIKTDAISEVNEQPKRKNKKAASFYEHHVDIFLPKDFAEPRIKRSLALKKSTYEMLECLFQIVGGRTKKHNMGDFAQKASRSAFIDYLVVSHYENHKDEIDAFMMKK